MNKFELINKVLVCDMKREAKLLAIELIMRANDEGISWPSTARLAQVVSIKHAKNFKGAEFYLPGLVKDAGWKRVGKGYVRKYQLDYPALEGYLNTAKVETEDHYPASADGYPATEGYYYPALADGYPAVEGSDSTKDTTEDSSIDTTTAPSAHEVADAPSDLKNKEDQLAAAPHEHSLIRPIDEGAVMGSTTRGYPATEGYPSEEPVMEEWIPPYKRNQEDTREERIAKIRAESARQKAEREAARLAEEKRLEELGMLSW